jgi:hypothetical protein
MKKNNFLLFVTTLLFVACADSGIQKDSHFKDGEILQMDKSVLQDKIKGGWAGQVIGCAYAGPTEFNWQGAMIHNRVQIPWDENQLTYWYDNAPGLFDDIYMDLTFVSTFENHGLDASADHHALAFANAGYPLWHANQAARYNILHGVMPPESGHWKNNPHADDIDYQIEADFAGLMSPGMINSASEISDKIGHIMNYGVGWYGGVYVGAMYTQAFLSNDINFVVREALKSIPEESRYYKTIADVISLHEQYPDDWQKTWFEMQRRWGAENHCPDGIFRAFNIEANMNSAWIVLGLLYGDGDFGKTIDISMRAGDDSDCNPSNAAGILGTILGYSNIPNYWMQGLDKVEDRNFSHFDVSLQNAYDMSFRHALEMIEKNGGEVTSDIVEIKYQKAKPVRFEISSEDLYPAEKIAHDGWPRPRKRLNTETTEYTNSFTGAGFLVGGNATKTNSNLPDRDLTIDVYINNVFVETVALPTDSRHRKLEVYWNFDLPEENHNLRLETNDVPQGYNVNIRYLTVYSRKDPGPMNY